MVEAFEWKEVKQKVGKMETDEADFEETKNDVEKETLNLP